MEDNSFNDNSDFNDWGDDPFEGDMDFDMDFDNPGGKKGFLRSFGSGFLDGLVERTVGSSEAKIKTLQRSLPETWAPTFRNLRDFNTRRREILQDLKENSYETVQDLQYLAKRASSALSDKIPNKISDDLNSFSTRDFSDWERSDYSSDDDAKIKETTDDEVKALLNNEDANSSLDRQTVKAVGKETIGIMTEIGGRSIAGMHSIVQNTVRTNQLLEHLLDYQRRVQQRNDALQLNILARHHLTSAAYFRFSEVANHKIIEQLKTVSKYSQMSDYEKTSNSQAMRKNIRESVFNTAKSKFGGIAEFIIEKLGKDARDETASNVQEITSSLRMVAEMTEGMPINVGSLLGNAAAGIFLNQLPKAIQSGKGQELLGKFKSQFPELSKWASDAYIRLGDLGNVASYITGNAEQLANTLSKHYNGGTGFDDQNTYDDYLATLAPDVVPMPKAQWWVLKTARANANKAAGSVLDNMWSPTNSTYQLQQRTLADGHEQALWSRRSDRTLNEEIPRWFALVHQSLEKIRTGNDAVGTLSYDYTKASFINSKQKFAKVTNDILGRQAFSTQASMASSLAAKMDEGNVLTKEQKDALAFQLIKDSDRKLGFNPYNMMDLQEEGHDKKTSDAIRKMLMQNFNITEDDLNKFAEADEVTKSAMLTYMRGEKARAKLVDYADATNSLNTFSTDLSEKIDIYKANGFYDALKEAGIITKSEHGDSEEINEKLLDQIMKLYIKDPNRKNTILEAGDETYLPTRGFGGNPPAPAPVINGPLPSPLFGGPSVGSKPPSEDNPLPVKVMGFEELLASFKAVKNIPEVISNLGESVKGLENLSKLNLDITPINNSLDKLINEVGTLVKLADLRNKTLTGIHDNLPPARKKKTKEEEQELRSGKDRIIDKIKEFSFKEFFNKSVDTVLRNEPLILGGLLGGLAGVALHNPKAAALIAGGAGIAMAYGKLRSLATARNAEDNEDLYEEGSDTPILEAWKRKRGDYYDAVTKEVIKKWSDIKNSVYDKQEKVIIGAKRLAGKLFTAENKEVILSGLNKVREFLGKAFDYLDPIGRVKSFANKVTTRLYQMNVYKEGAKEPTLYGKSFAGGAYWKRDSSGNVVELKGWNEIDGPVYDRDGNVLITQDDFDRGLKTSMGVSINKLNSVTKKAAGWLWDAGKLAKDKAMEYGGKGVDKAKGMLKADYTPITNSIDRIYHLLMDHWGYKPSINFNEGIAPDNDNTKVSEEVVEERKQKEKVNGKVDKYDSTEAFGKKVAEHVGANDNRLNSLADQDNKKKAKKKSMVDDAIIGIGKAFGVGDKDGKQKPERTGLFGMLTSMMGGIGSTLLGLSNFFTKTLWGGMTTLFRFAGMGLKVLPAIGTGIAAISKGLFTLLKTRSITQAGGDLMDSLRGDPNEHPEAKKKRKRDRAERSRSTGGRLKKAGMAGALAYGASVGLDSLIDANLIEEGDLTDSIGNVVEKGAMVYGGYQVASLAAGLAGKVKYRNVFTLGEGEYKNPSEAERLAKVSSTSIQTAIYNNNPRSVYGNCQWKRAEDETPWEDLNEYELECVRLKLQANASAYEVTNVRTKEKWILYGNDAVAAITGANTRTVMVCAREGKLLLKKYSLKKLTR